MMLQCKFYRPWFLKQHWCIYKTTRCQVVEVYYKFRFYNSSCNISNIGQMSK
jgi:hypothetical protein